MQTVSLHHYSLSLVYNDLISKAGDHVTASRPVRGEIKEIIATTHTRKQQAHELVNTTLQRSIEESKAIRVSDNIVHKNILL